MIILSAGHYPESPGACFPEDNANWCEHAEAVLWINHIALKVRQQMKVAIVQPAPLRDKILWINGQCHRNDVKLAMELHFNSDPSKRGRGCETLYCPGSEQGEMLANILQGALASLFPPNRGAKEGWYKMILPPDPRARPDAFLGQKNCPALILEPEFMHNRSTIEANRNTACDVIADALIEAANHA